MPVNQMKCPTDGLMVNTRLNRPLENGTAQYTLNFPFSWSAPLSCIYDCHKGIKTSNVLIQLVSANWFYPWGFSLVLIFWNLETYCFSIMSLAAKQTESHYVFLAAKDSLLRISNTGRAVMCTFPSKSPWKMGRCQRNWLCAIIKLSWFVSAGCLKCCISCVFFCQVTFLKSVFLSSMLRANKK